MADAARRLQAQGLLLMLASGAAGLGYQIVWTQQAALWLGHEGAAALAVVAAFFGGLALGAWALGGAVGRSTRPGRWYAGCEAAVALWCAVLFFAMEPFAAALAAGVGAEGSPARQAWMAGLGTFALLLPATAAMGATLPAMARLVGAWQTSGTRIAALYASNTLGGVLGVLGAAFYALPTWGLSATAAACAALNLLCAAVAWRMPLAAGVDPEAKDVEPAARPLQSPLWAGALVLTGLLGVGYEVIALRVLSQVAENTVYTLALLLAVYLVGTAAGAAWWAVRGQRWPASARSRSAGLVLLLATSVLVCGSALRMAPWFKAALALWLGAGETAALTAEALLALLAFGPPTLVMGALFSVLCESAANQGLGFSRALALNTAGAALAPWVWGAGLLVTWGAQRALVLLVLAYALLAWVLQRRVSPGLAWVCAGGMALSLAPPLRVLDIPEGGRVVSYQDGELGAVSVTESPSGERLLRINNRQQEGSNTTALADARQAWLPLLLHPAPRQALFVGLGTGVTARAAAQDLSMQVQAVELLPEVVEASRLFRGAVGEDSHSDRLVTHVADARRFMRSSRAQWDVIVADNFHPARAGSASLYTVEHFQAVRARLAPGGLFCQWLPLHQMDLATLQSIVRSFLVAFPQGRAMLATNSLQTPVLGLLALPGPEPSPDTVAARLKAAAAGDLPQQLGLGAPWPVLGSVVAGPVALTRWSAGAPLNTDDHPVVAYLAPRATYEPASTPAARLMALLSQWQAWAAAETEAPPPRVAAYRAARQAFLEAGLGVRATPDAARMLQQVQVPLLAVIRTSPDFEPAVQPLLRMADALQASDPTAARALQQAVQAALRP